MRADKGVLAFGHWEKWMGVFSTSNMHRSFLTINPSSSAGVFTPLPKAQPSHQHKTSAAAPKPSIPSPPRQKFSIAIP